MGASSRALAVCVAAVACALAACDGLLGLGDYTISDCPGPNCDAGIVTGFDASDARDATDASETSTADGRAYDAEGGWDVSVQADASEEDAHDVDVVVPDAPLEIGPPSVHMLWANWAMPNPDAAI